MEEKFCDSNAKLIFRERKITAQKMKFSIKDFFSKCDQMRSPEDLVTFTKEILNGKLHFLCSEYNRLLLNFF